MKEKNQIFINIIKKTIKENFNKDDVSKWVASFIKEAKKFNKIFFWNKDDKEWNNMITQTLKNLLNESKNLLNNSLDESKDLLDKIIFEEELNVEENERPEIFSFSNALHLLKKWRILTRTGWNWKNQYVALQERTDKSKMTQDYLYIKTAQNELVPWLPSQGDLLAEDWTFYLNPTEIKEETIVTVVEL